LSSLGSQIASRPAYPGSEVIVASSSYTNKVYPRLLKTADGQALQDRILHQLQTLNVVSYTFEVAGAWGTGEASMQVHTKFKFVGDRFTISQSFDDDTLSNIQPDNIALARDKLLHESDDGNSSDATAVVHSRLGKDKGVPTFNCLKEVCLKGKEFSYKSGKANIPSFGVWLWDEIIRKAPEFQAAKERLYNQIIKLRKSEDLLQARKEAQAQFACESIKNLMMKYSWLGDDTMKRAVQTFVIGDILET